MNFSTKIPIGKSVNLITHDSKITSFGSCFAENMAEKLEYFKFQNLVNPFGIIFNSVSIYTIIRRIVNQELFTEKDIFFHNNLWHSYEVHSQLSNPDKNLLLQNLNNILKSTYKELLESSHIIITYGTSWIYRNIKNNKIVANCHKVEQKFFSKELLTADENQTAVENTIELLHSINKSIAIIFTVSPVRHIKDGFIENNVSKSNLIIALYKTINQSLPSINYFPSYEIMMDELRDYRFYKADMLHPNDIAIDYIWEKFIENLISDQSLLIMNDVEKIQKMINHKSFNSQSIQNKEFKLKIQAKLEKLQAKHPQIIF